MEDLQLDIFGNWLTPREVNPDPIELAFDEDNAEAEESEHGS